MTRSVGPWIVLISGVLLGNTPPASAHQLLLTCKVDGDRVRVEAFFDDDTPAQEATITVAAADGRGPLTEGKTDERGIWTFPTPSPGSYAVRAACLGHTVHTSFTVATNAEAPVEPSRQELTRTPWLRVGIGLGVIAGLCALVLWVRRNGPQPPADVP